MLKVVGWNRKDWIGVSLKILLFILPLSVTLAVLFLLFMPMADMIEIGLLFFADESKIVEFRDVALYEGFSYGQILFYYMFTLAGGILIPVLILFWIMFSMLRFGDWMAKKIIISDPIIYFKGKQISPKVKTLKDDKED